MSPACGLQEPAARSQQRTAGSTKKAVAMPTASLIYSAIAGGSLIRGVVLRDHLPLPFVCGGIAYCLGAGVVLRLLGAGCCV
jgi:hypothetical protein